MSAIVVNKKRNGKIRLCLDPQPLSKALKRCHYPTPTIEEVLPDLANAKVFTKLDCKNGYWQVKLDQDSSILTTFNTPFGRYNWTRMPFGISPAGEIFQRRLDQAIEGLGRVRTVADDVLIGCRCSKRPRHQATGLAYPVSRAWNQIKRNKDCPQANVHAVHWSSTHCPRSKGGPLQI